MCLITKRTKAKIALEDITVYKLLNKTEDVLLSPYYSNFVYEMYKIYETEMGQTDDFSCFDEIDKKALKEEYNYSFNNDEKKLNLISIGPGFHSSKTIERLTSEYRNLILVECIIPKGAEYYEGLADLMVSNKIIINKIIYN